MISLSVFAHDIVAKVTCSHHFLPNLKFKRNSIKIVLIQPTLLDLKISIFRGIHIDCVRKIYVCLNEGLWNLMSSSFYGNVDEDSEPMEWMNSLPPTQLNPRDFTTKSHVYMLACVYAYAHVLPSDEVQCRVSLMKCFSIVSLGSNVLVDGSFYSNMIILTRFYDLVLENSFH